MQCRPALVRALCLLAVPLALGCNDHPLKEVELERTSVDTTVLDIEPYRDLDILFVIDNSGSMGEEQATLAANFGAFIEVLEDEFDANYRIGITTTDNGHPNCGATGPEAGALVLQSCVDRLQQFVWDNGTEVVDRQAEACTDLCPPELSGLQTVPTASGRPGDNEQRSRPWLERIEGVTNLPEEIETDAAFACLGPQGIDGCGFESPLEAMYKTIARSSREDENEVGFIRDEALLAVVFVTDEVDCSMQAAGAAAFDPNGTRTLWSDPDLGYPTSAVCWNAGVHCEPGPDGLECRSADFDTEGNPADPDAAVLHPMSRYTQVLESLLEQKREARQEADVVVAVISGVPSNYPTEAISYAQGVDPTFETSYGIAPGCSSGHGEAVPPVRLRELAEAFPGVDEQPLLFSICDEDYRPALRALATDFVEQLGPTCTDICPTDADPVAAGLQPACVITEEYPDGQSQRVPFCEQDAQGSAVLPEGASVCVSVRVGDDRHPECIEQGSPSQFEIVRDPDVPRVGGARLQTECSLSDDVASTCG